MIPNDTDRARIADKLADVLYYRLKEEGIWHPILRSINAATRIQSFETFLMDLPNATASEAKTTRIAREVANDAGIAFDLDA